jgi:hypothetical protein
MWLPKSVILAINEIAEKVFSRHAAAKTMPVHEEHLHLRSRLLRPLGSRSLDATLRAVSTASEVKEPPNTSNYCG